MSDEIVTSYAKGRMAERRFKEIAQNLSMVPVVKIVRAHGKIRKIMDFIVHVCNDDSGVLRIPVQVKSSAESARVFRTEYPDIEVMVVNEYRTDEEICDEFNRAIENIIARGLDSESQSAMIAEYIKKNVRMAKDSKRSDCVPWKGRRPYGTRPKEDVKGLPSRCRGVHKIADFYMRHAEHAALR